MEEFNYINILKCWNIDFLKTEKDINIYGSPERSDFRVVIKDKSGSLFILEKIPINLIKRKEEIAENIFKLKKQNERLKVFPYLLNINSQLISKENNDYWLLSPFIRGVDISRLEYIEEDWRGKVMGDFLIELGNTEIILVSVNYKNNIFALDEYVLKIEVNMKKLNPSEYLLLKNVIDYLKTDFFPIYSKLPTSFCHGDYHPLNIIWSKDDIEAVIDWEFCGFKPEMYDAANMIGCLGMENPKALYKKIIINFLNTLLSNRLYSQISLNNFLNLVISIRFGWLSEWLRKGDIEMLNLEVVYINLLYEKGTKLMNFWNLKQENYLFR